MKGFAPVCVTIHVKAHAQTTCCACSHRCACMQGLPAMPGRAIPLSQGHQQMATVLGPGPVQQLAVQQGEGGSWVVGAGRLLLLLSGGGQRRLSLHGLPIIRTAASHHGWRPYLPWAHGMQCLPLPQPTYLASCSLAGTAHTNLLHATIPAPAVYSTVPVGNSGFATQLAYYPSQDYGATSKCTEGD